MNKNTQETKHPSFINRLFQSLSQSLKKGFSRLGKSFQRFYDRFRDGSTGTKVSHLVMGFGNLTRKQYAKGILYLGLQIIFIFFMVSSPVVNSTPFGWKSLGNMITLGTEAGDLFNPTDNSMLMLLFGVVTVGIIAVFIIVYLSNIKSSYATDLRLRKGKEPTTFKEDIASLFDSRFHVLMLTPAMIGVLIFTVLPTIFMILIAFTNFDSDHIPGQHLIDWVGFANFAAVFSGTGEIAVRFVPVLTWTLTWAFFATFTNYIAGILLALLINRKQIKFKKMWRTIFILTIALPQFISLLAMRNLLSLYGPINSALVNMGILEAPIEFLGLATSATTARITILVINLWVGIPYTMLMTSGILMNVPADLYEAAQIDGATRRQAFFNITVPYILFVTAPYLITSFIGNITSFNIIFLLTGGDPVVPGYKAGQTDLLVTWLYSLTIEESDVSIGSVIAIFTFILTATATLISYRRSKSYKEEDAFQ
ncbi:MAG: sugar ABC transporter permease [bacterium]|nr:sugar ABC transporter permease [bacterium]